ncbi:MAG TPA: TonB-dependent receptor [Thermoanaerobaculia bacterium]|jgi:iron complex outermembrane receptor protein|nr:TonB-dependent receptor [Thermoanaerobaculia bacterium]
MTCRSFFLRALALGLATFPTVASAQAPATDPDATPAVEETIQVTATRVPEDVESVPVSITVISGDELRARGATDLASALSNIAGVTVAPGGDVGPAGSVPEMWGLREFDAFLLVVDGVPWGGAFNPALTTLDLTDVERIEVLRGSAPVMYGATSFVGVIHVLHRQAGAEGTNVRVSGGNYSSGSASVSLALPSSGSFRQSLLASGERQGFKDDRTGYDRGHVLYRAATGGFHLDLDGSIVKQDPASPHPRQGRVLSSLVPLDANYNPRDAHIDEDRFQLALGYDKTLARGAWSTTLALTHSKRDTLRGFLSDLSNSDPNAIGFEQELETNDAYFDTHVTMPLSSNARVIAGLDHLFGRAEAESESFEYFAPLNGRTVPSDSTIDPETHFDMEDERNFSGVYLQTEWDPHPRWHFMAGARLNYTSEDREAGEEPLNGEEPEGEEEEEGSDKRTVTRGSGMVGVSWLAWQQDANGVWIFADYRNTYKPAALDFGPEAEPEILEPETANSYEIGLKGRHGRFNWELTGFQMDFENLVVAQEIGGLPALVNAGNERFRGTELELDYRILDDLTARGSYSRHDAIFKDYVQDFDGVPTQLDGNRLELSPKELAGAELVWSPDHGLVGFASWNHTGERFLNKRNTALAPAYDLWSAGLGYRFGTWELRVDGFNLTDERDPVAESELGDAQYYRQPARSYRLTWAARF